MKLIPVLVFALTISGCSSKGFNKGALRQELSTYETREITEEEIKKVFDLKPQLPKPFKVGVFFVDNSLQSYEHRWYSDDKHMILKLEDELKKTGEVSELFLINESVVTGTDIKSARLAAAHHGADALLMISGVHDEGRYSNPWAASYILLLPALFAPGTEIEAVYITRAALWDVRNEFLYMAVESESFKKKKAPAAFADQRELLSLAKTESLEGLNKEILRMMNQMQKKKAP